MQHQLYKHILKEIEKIKRFVLSKFFAYSIGSLAFILPCINLSRLIQTRSDFFIQQIGTKEYRDLTYIKPFTSLVGFNWKFCKEVRHEEKKKLSITLPFMN